MIQNWVCEQEWNQFCVGGNGLTERPCPDQELKPSLCEAAVLTTEPRCRQCRCCLHSLRHRFKECTELFSWVGQGIYIHINNCRFCSYFSCYLIVLCGMKDYKLSFCCVNMCLPRIKQITLNLLWGTSGIFCSFLLKRRESSQFPGWKGAYIYLELVLWPAGEFAGTLERLRRPAKPNSHTLLLYTVEWGRERSETVLWTSSGFSWLY